MNNPAEIIRVPDPASRPRWQWWPQVTILLLVALEMAWLVPWYRMVIRVSEVASPLRAALALGGVMYTAYLGAYWMENLRLRANIKLWAMVLILVLGLVASLQLLLGLSTSEVAGDLARQDPGAILVFFFVLWAWWRGFALGGEAVRPLLASRRFFQSLFMYFLYVFISARLFGWQAAFGLFAFLLLVGLMAMVLARISFVSLSRGVRKSPFDRRWLGMVVGIVVLTVAATVTAGSLVTGQYPLLLEWLAQALRDALAVAIFIFSIPGLLLSTFLGPLVPWLRAILPDPPGEVEDPLEIVPRLPGAESASLSQEAQAFIFWGLALLLLVLLFGWVSRRLWASRRRELPGDQAESLLEEGEARRLLKQGLRQAAENMARRLQHRRQLMVVARIRRIYVQLEHLCADLNLPRPRAKTPLEYQASMGELFPTLGVDLDLLIQAYVQVRYGELPEHLEQMSAIESAWDRIQKEGQRLKRAGRGRLKQADVHDVQRTGF